MTIQLLYFPGCPHHERARRSVRAAIALAGLPATFEELDTTAATTPAPLARWGSPTVLVDGVDVGGAHEPTGATCRLYPEGGAPTTSMVLAAIRARRQPGARP